MLKKLIVLIILSCAAFLLFPPIPQHHPLTSVFRITEDPVAITHGSHGSALTVNISFGDAEVADWLQELKQPYPLLFIDVDWAKRFPNSVRIINEKNIPTGLLGHNGAAYEEDAKLLVNQLEQFESFFEMKPLWFRTADEVFPHFLHTILWEAEVNALGSSFVWEGGSIPPVMEGEIISVPHHRNARVQLQTLQKLMDSREFKSVEDVLFGTSVKMKKIPQ